MNTTVMGYPGTVHTARAGDIRMLWLAYILHALLVTAPLGLLINLYELHGLRRRAADPEVVGLRQHHVWLVRTLVVTVLLVPITIGWSYYLWGFAVGIVGAAWWLYRIVRGIRALALHQTVPTSL